jgi:hypothetical protein
MANEKGGYSIIAQKGEVLVISAIGHKAKEIVVDADNNISVSLEIIKLDEVVVVGYQTVKGRVMMGAVSRVSRRTFFKEQEEPKKNTSLLTIYPNPATAGTGIHTELKKPAEGYYTYMLTSASGQTVHQQQIWIDKTAKVLSLDIPHIPAGTYILSLINKVSGNKLTEKIVVQ